MAILNLDQFLQDYFLNHECSIIENHNGLLKVQLTEEMDKALMNRPFYWHYMKKTGQQGQPMTLTLITNPNRRDEKGEWIHFGSPRLQQIFNHLKENEKYVKLFQQLNVFKQTPLYPWLVVNIKLSYQGKQKKDEILSIGLQMVNGTIRLSMMDYLKQLVLQPTISDYCYTLSPLIRLQSGFRRIENYLYQHIQQDTHEWAVESLRKLKEEKETVRHFYKHEEEQEQLKKEIEELEQRYQPTISYTVINGGLFYLTK